MQREEPLDLKSPIEEDLAGAEAYLEAIFVLTTENRQVQAARIRDYLGVSAVSVSRALTRLDKRGDLLERAPEVRLTEQGWKRAEAVVRRHRLAERWLSDKLGLSLVEAHREAERLEHALSDRVEDALWEDLGRPTTCPHGNPIPGLDGAPIELEPLKELSEVDPGTYMVDRIFEQLEGLEERLDWIEQSDLIPGAIFSVLPSPEGDRANSAKNLPTYIAKADGTEIEVPYAIASRLLVRPLEGTL